MENFIYNFFLMSDNFFLRQIFLSYKCWGRAGTGGDFWRCRERVGEQFSKMLGPGTGWILKMPGSGSFSKNDRGPGRSLVPQTPESMLPNALSNPIAL